MPQHSSVECGVACLAMVLAYHGKHVAREELRSALGPTRDGVRAAHLLRTGRHFGLRGRGFKAELDALRQVPRGAVLHWQFNHYVVLQGVGKQHIDIVDPARGPRRVPWHELDKAFTGVVLIFEPGADFVTSDNRPKRKGLYANLLRAGDWKRIFSISFASQLVSLALPMLVALIVDRVLPRSDEQLLYVVAIGLALIAAFYGLSQIVRGHLLLHLRTVLDAKMSMELVDRMLALPFTFFQQRSVGDLILRLESSKMVREVLTSGALTAVLDGTMMILYLGLLLAISPMLGLVVVCLGAVNVLVLVASRGRRRAFHAEMIDRQAASESYQFEMLTAMETLKGMGCEQRAIDRWCNLFVDMLNNQLQFGRLEIDREARVVRVDGVERPLTSYQFELLCVLAVHAGRVMSREAIMERVRGEELEAFDRSIDVHIARIRAALEDDPKHPRRIITVRGAGYVFAKDQDDERER